MAHVARPARQIRGYSCKDDSTLACGRKRPPPPSAVADRMQQQDKPGPYWPGRARIRPVKPHHRTAAGMPLSPPPSRREPAPPSTGGAATAPEAAHPNLDGAQRAPIWAEGRRRPRAGDQLAGLRLPRHPAAKRPRHRHRDHPDRARTGAWPKCTATGRRRRAATPRVRGKAGRRRRHRTGNARRPAPAAAERERGGRGGERRRLGFAPARPRGGRDRSERGTSPYD
jgi:hypothetical protein